MSLLHKTAVITGASRGIGAAIARSFAQADCNLALIYRSSHTEASLLKEELQKYGAKINTYSCDVANYKEVEQTFKDIFADFGQIDILVNNAGITKDKLLAMMKEEDFDSVLDTNLKGAFNCCKQVYGPFLRQREGCIINISSVAGLMGNRGQTNYAASKAGLIGFTKSLAKELAPKGITVNAIAPGFIDTEMTENIDSQNPLLKAIPMARLGQPQDVAKLALFLAGDDATYITGEIIRVDGGLAM